MKYCTKKCPRYDPATENCNAVAEERKAPLGRKCLIDRALGREYLLMQPKEGWRNPVSEEVALMVAVFTPD
jgi:hypothetical protein